MRKYKLFPLIFIIVLIVYAQLFAQSPRLGEKLFENAQYPQNIGNTNKISFYHHYTNSDGKIEYTFAIGDITTGEIEYLDFKLNEPPRRGTLAWNPEGTHAALVRKDLTDCDIYKYSLKKPFEITRLSDLSKHAKILDDEFRETLKIDENSIVNVAYPDWSRDGKKIAFNLVIPTEGAIYVLDIESSRITQVTKNKYGVFPSWSKDGKVLYIIGRSDTNMNPAEDIYAVNMDDFTLEQVTDDPAREMNVHVSPDGNYLLYTKKIKGERQTIYVLDLKSNKEAELVILGEEGACINPTWSGDGKFVLYQLVGLKGSYPQINKISFNSNIFK